MKQPLHWKASCWDFHEVLKLFHSLRSRSLAGFKQEWQKNIEDIKISGVPRNLSFLITGPSEVACGVVESYIWAVIGRSLNLR